MAGYSGTPLIKKLGIKAGHFLCCRHVPDDYLALLGDLPADVTWQPLETHNLDFVHAFYIDRALLEGEFPRLKAAIKRDGMIWISWPKKASKVPTDLNENVVREIGLAAGLVDVKVAAVDAIWSGLKFVYRVADR